MDVTAAVPRRCIGGATDEKRAAAASDICVLGMASTAWAGAGGIADWRGILACQSGKGHRRWVSSPPRVMPLALGVAPPSLSGALLAAPATDCVAGEERKKRGDCVDESCRRLALGVAFSPRWEAWEASDCSWASGPSGAGLESIWEFRVLLRGVAEARCERRCAGEDICTAMQRLRPGEVWAVHSGRQ